MRSRSDLLVGPPFGGVAPEEGGGALDLGGIGDAVGNGMAAGEPELVGQRLVFPGPLVGWSAPSMRSVEGLVPP